MMVQRYNKTIWKTRTNGLPFPLFGQIQSLSLSKVGNPQYGVIDRITRVCPLASILRAYRPILAALPPVTGRIGRCPPYRQIIPAICDIYRRNRTYVRVTRRIGCQLDIHSITEVPPPTQLIPCIAENRSPPKVMRQITVIHRYGRDGWR